MPAENSIAAALHAHMEVCTEKWRNADADIAHIMKCQQEIKDRLVVIEKEMIAGKAITQRVERFIWLLVAASVSFVVYLFQAS